MAASSTPFFRSSSRMCSSTGLPKRDTMGFGSSVVRGWSRVPAPPAKMTAFIVKGRPFPEFLLVWTACRLFMLCSVVGYKWPQPQSTGMVSSSRIQSATGTTVYAVLVLRITTRSTPR